MTSQIKVKDCGKNRSQPESTLAAPEFQDCLAVPTELKTMFPRGCWEGGGVMPSHVTK